jgi:hypothetical protein
MDALRSDPVSAVYLLDLYFKRGSEIVCFKKHCASKALMLGSPRPKSGVLLLA